MTAGTDRRVIAALLGIAALCLIGLGASVYRAKADQLKTLQRELEQKESQLEDVRTKLASQPQLEERYDNLQARLSVLEPALPDSAYIPTFLRQIEGLATGTQNRITMIRPKPAAHAARPGNAAVINDETGEISQSPGQSDQGKARKAGEVERLPLPYDHVPIELKIEGTYWTLIDFLAELQRFPKMIAVNNIGFYPDTRDTDAQRSPRLAANMDLTAVVTKGAKDGQSQ
jgi:Tfp pilus assembly protein PilO